ncbi:YVTN family beta-propeller repeat protein [Desulfolithobacter sp.]
MELTIETMELLADNGRWNLISDRPITISSRKLRDGQRFLARNYLPQGRYSRLRLTLDQARLGNSTLSLASPAIELPLRGPLYVGSGDSRSLFLTWDVKRSILDNGTLQPVLQVAPRLKHLMVDVAYVACPEIDTVFMIRTDKNWVCDSLGVQGEPTYLAPSPLYPRENLYVLTRRDQDIKKVAPSANRVVETYSLPMTGNPIHMALSPDGRWGYIVDRKRGNILRMDMLSGHIDQRVRLGYGPCYVLFLEKTNLVAVSLSLAQTVVLLDPESLTTVRTISTGSRPEGLTLWNDTLLYVAESGANSVLIYDLESNRERSRIPVGFSPRRLIATSNFIYVANHGSRSLSLLSPEQLGVTRSVPLTGRPLELAEVKRSRWIYVGNEDRNGLTIIDPVTSRVAGFIELGGRPTGIAIID